MKKIILMLAVLALIAAACSSGGDVLEVGAPPDDAQESGETPDGDDPPEADEADEVDEATEEDDAPVASTGGGGDFCAIAVELDSNDPFEDLSIFDGAAFFDAADDLWDKVRAAAPPELQEDVNTLAGGLDEMQGILEQYDYDFFNEEVGAAMFALDTTAMDTAGASIERYANDVCGVDFNAGSSPDNDGLTEPPEGLEDLVGDLEDFDPENTAEVFAQIFGIDQELAECLVDEFGELDTDNIDAATLSQPVCGTTLLEIVSGLGG